MGYQQNRAASITQPRPCSIPISGIVIPGIITADSLVTLAGLTETSHIRSGYAPPSGREVEAEIPYEISEHEAAIHTHPG